jgi:hypothetical protein
MARIYDEPLNVGGKEKLQREAAVKEMHEQEEAERKREILEDERQRVADQSAELEKKLELEADHE